MFQVDHLECDVFFIQLLAKLVEGTIFSNRSIILVRSSIQIVRDSECLPALHAVLIFGPFEQSLGISCTRRAAPDYITPNIGNLAVIQHL
jgi:hypothetical protein